MLSNKTFVTLWFYTIFLIILSVWMNGDNQNKYGIECYDIVPNGSTIVLLASFAGLTTTIFILGLFEMMN